MAYLHHGSIRKYTAALLDFFNNVEIQYKLSTGEMRAKDVPLKYSSQEKTRVFDNHTVEQLLSGNFSVLPRGSLSLVSMSKSSERVTNKNSKINQYKTDTTLEYMYNSVPYEFLFDITFQCRGMNEATQIIEQIAPKFNPTVNIDIWDASNLNEPTRVPVRLVDISLEQQEYEEISSNIVTVVLSLSLMGNLYPPIKAMPRIQEFQIYLNQIENETQASRKEMMEWDVDLDGYIIGGGLDIYANELTNPIQNNNGSWVYDPNDTKVAITADRVGVFGFDDYFTSKTLDGILNEIYTTLNTPSGLLQLNPDGTIDASLLPEQIITGYVSGVQQTIDGQIVFNVELTRVDNYINNLNIEQVFYNVDTYCLTDDLPIPANKICYIQYEGNAVIAYAYNSIGKISRLDYYKDINNFNMDGSGRDGYSILNYNAEGKLLSFEFIEV